MQGILEQNGKTSSTRVAMMLCVVTACVIAVAGVVGSIHAKQPVDQQLSWLVGTLLSIGFGGKVMQKSKEAPSG